MNEIDTNDIKYEFVHILLQIHIDCMAGFVGVYLQSKLSLRIKRSFPVSLMHTKLKFTFVPSRNKT